MSGRCIGLLVLVASLWGCSGEKTKVGCTADEDCDTGLFCQTETGACRCRTDDACGVGYYCNSFGACQARPPCLGNQDCADGFICNSADPTGGVCIPASTCGSSVHCELNSYCDPQTRTCKPGCRNTGDCQLGRVCVAGQCTPGGTANDCTTCPTSPDPNADYCDYGELCVSGECVAHPQKNALCNTCGTLNPCPSGTVCLIDPEEANKNYCSPGCKLDKDCPQGYGQCGSLTIVFESCTDDRDCTNGGRCLGSAESDVAFCSCTSQADCAYTSMCLGGTCTGLQLPCSSNADCTLTCVQTPFGENETVGTCMTTAKVCGKDAGLTCDTAKNEEAACRGLHD